MKLGLTLNYGTAHYDPMLAVVKAADRLGYDSVWTAEIYGSDAMTPLAFLAAHTDHIRLGTGVVQLAARTPANCAMSIATIDQLAGGGRAILGVGVSGPQIVEGWYGEPWGSPVHRLRDYITIVRQILDRERAEHTGREISLPYQGPGSTGQGKPLKLILHPTHRIPIFLGCGGPASVALMAELCDGWLPMGMSAENFDDAFRPHLDRGLARADRSLDELEIASAATVVVTDDVEGEIARRKPAVAFRVGGYGSAQDNFHRDAMKRRGFVEEAEQIQELFLAGRRDEAAAAVPDAYIDDGALIGPEDRIRDRFAAIAAGPSTTLRIATHDIATLELMADIADLTPPAPKDQP